MISDSGTITTWAARHIEMRGDMQFSALGHAGDDGQRPALRDRRRGGVPGPAGGRVVGDGGFTMLMGEMATLVKYKLPVKVIVIKNNALGQIKWEQMAMEGNPEFGVDLQPIDFATHAQACGAAGFTLDDPAKCRAVLREALAHPGPAVDSGGGRSERAAAAGQRDHGAGLHFAEALLRGEKNRWKSSRPSSKDKVREVI